MIRSKQEKGISIIAYVVLGIVMLMIIYPFLLLFMSSITDEQVLLTEGYSLFPKKINFAAYEYILSTWSTIGRAYLTTIGITAVGTAVNVTITALCAYPLSLDRLRGRRILNFFFLFTMLFNGGLIPTYLVYTSIFHIRNTYFALLVPNLLFSSYNCIIIRSYLQNNIPVELYDAARIDGASELKIFSKMVIPLAKPIFVTVGIFVGLSYWNDWTNGMYYVDKPSLYSIQQLLNVMIENIKFLQQYAPGNIANIPSQSFRMAIAIVAMIPILVLYPFLQRFFRSGIMVGSIKG